MERMNLWLGMILPVQVVIDLEIREFRIYRPFYVLFITANT